MSSPAKSLFLAGGAGSVGLVTYGGYLTFKNEDSQVETSQSIWQVVSSKKEKFVLSTDTTSHDAEWEEISKGLVSNEDAKSALGVVAVTKDSLKVWCSKTKIENSEEGLLENYESWCTKNSNFGQLATLKKIALEEGDSQWDENVKKYPNKGDTSNTNYKLTDEKGTVKSEYTLKDKNELIDWCNKNLRSLYKENSPTTQAYMQWCVKEVVSSTNSSPSVG
ncbi:hypothetical protein HF1_01470 [Mycoplasma haemofelis str. Langford 1]|uniref:Uncharacterized protein n=2 Tax=Mycoplasma haemofelis TaxID=29501 RepID=F6FG02_MYCHI|nr:hypothetical protein [Mycoplasma haemofelis]AEG72468.1 hypothetical protein MHF_0167 [Mycoplasma haemofelis Ohio2]CBY92155.1 hypothetical protein HF1_01470 [Mycoplasma haemofelis str. Langford 1]